MIAVTNTVPKHGILRSDGSVDIIPPMVTQVTVPLLHDVINTEWDVYLRVPMENIVGFVFHRGGSRFKNGALSNMNHCVGFCNAAGTQVNGYMLIDPETSPLPQDAVHRYDDRGITAKVQNAPWAAGDPEHHYSYVPAGLGTGKLRLKMLVDTISPEDNDHFLVIKAFGGDEVTNFFPFSQTMGANANPVTVSGIGAEPDLVYLATLNDDTAIADFDDMTLKGVADANFSYGFAINDGSNSQACISVTAEKESGTPGPDPRIAHYIGDDATLTSIDHNAGTLNYKIVVENFQNGSIDLNPSAATSNEVVIGAAITFSDDVQLAIVSGDLPTSGVYTQADVGFRPIAAEILGITKATSYSTVFRQPLTGFFLYHAHEDEQITQCMTFSDNATSWQIAGQSHNEMGLFKFYEPQADPSANIARFEADDFAFANTGWTCDPTTYPLTEVKIRSLAIG